MASSEAPSVGPDPEAFDHAFSVTKIRTDGDRIYYHGVRLVPRQQLLREVWAPFQQAGLDVYHTTRGNEDVLVAEEADNGVDGIPWVNLVLFVLTICSTLFVGAIWFHINPVANPGEIWKAWPFTASIMTVLGVHELGHYVMSRYHGVDASLPYFIPVPTLIGTMGAVIKMKGHMPNRKALFDIGVAGPLAGLVATIAVTIVGLNLEPVTVPQTLVESENTMQIRLGFPPLMELLAWLTGEPISPDSPTKSIHPVIIGGWVGMFVTFLNMLPVGQLDGGHIVRAMTSKYQETIAAVVPGLLIALAAFLHYAKGVPVRAVFVWVLWGGLALAVAFVGPAQPINDSEALGTPRKLIGLLTLVLGALCFTPVPVQIIT
jgi:membrane-associated protease RseP (regulator of RpoE activity)